MQAEPGAGAGLSEHAGREDEAAAGDGDPERTPPGCAA